MIAVNSIQLTVVTPETTLLKIVAQAVQFPLEDGQIGVLPGRAPMVGRLGMGELLVTTAESKTSYFIDGGFAQVKGGTLTLLTDEALELSRVSAEKTEEQFQAALSRVALTPTEQAAKHHDVERNRKLLALLGRR